MKKLLCLLLLPTAGFAQQQHFIIKGKIGKLNSPAVIHFAYTSVEGKEMADTAVLKDGTFVFKGVVSEPTIARLTLMHKGERLMAVRNADFSTVLLDNGTTVVNSKDSLRHAVITGTKLENDYIAVGKKKDAEEDKLVRMWNQFKSTPKELQDPGFGDAYQKTSNAVREAKAAIDYAYIQSHPASFLSVMLLVWHAPSDSLELVDKLYSNLDQSLKDSKIGEVIAKKLDSRKAILVGGAAPDFTAPDTIGNKISLAAFKGKYVLVDFWASWCKPCRAENPNVVNAFDQYKGKNFTVVSVSLDREEDRAKWLKAINDDHLQQWTQLCELLGWRSEVAAMYRIHSIPQNVLVDPKGVIIAKNLRGEELQQKLMTLFN